MLGLMETLFSKRFSAVDLIAALVVAGMFGWWTSGNLAQRDLEWIAYRALLNSEMLRQSMRQIDDADPVMRETFKIVLSRGYALAEQVVPRPADLPAWRVALFGPDRSFEQRANLLLERGMAGP